MEKSATRSCRCGQPATRLFLCPECHRITQRVSYWRKTRIRKKGGVWVLLSSTEELRKKGLLAVTEIELAVMEAARLKGWL